MLVWTIYFIKFMGNDDEEKNGHYEKDA
jgi:hypothetical protein